MTRVTNRRVLWICFALAAAVGVSAGLWFSLTLRSACLRSGTLVMTDHGATVIDRLRPGDLVVSYDHSIDRLVTSRVQRVLGHRMRWTSRIGFNGSELGVTNDHRIYSVARSEYVLAEDLNERDVFMSFDGQVGAGLKHTSFESVSIEGLREVYELDVEYPHNYFANGILVHNKSIQREDRSPGLPRGVAPAESR